MHYSVSYIVRSFHFDWLILLRVFFWTLCITNDVVDFTATYAVRTETNKCVFRQTFLRRVRLMSWHIHPSVCLSSVVSVTLMNPTHGADFSALFLRRLIALRSDSLYWILGKIQRNSRCKLNGRGYEKLTSFDQYLALFRKRYKILP